MWQLWLHRLICRQITWALSMKLSDDQVLPLSILLFQGNNSVRKGLRSSLAWPYLLGSNLGHNLPKSLQIIWMRFYITSLINYSYQESGTCRHSKGRVGSVGPLWRSMTHQVSQPPAPNKADTALTTNWQRMCHNLGFLGTWTRMISRNVQEVTSAGQRLVPGWGTFGTSGQIVNPLLPSVCKSTYRWWCT